MPPTPARPVHIAVIGDVGTDWSFIAGRPARTRPPSFQPWTQYPAAHLFAIPGGAWFSGHMIQGALSQPHFTRKHLADTRSGEDGKATHIALKGTHPKITPATPTIRIRIPAGVELTAPDGNHLYTIILDNTHEVPLSRLLHPFTRDAEYIELDVAVHSVAIAKALHSEFHLGLTDSTLHFGDDESVQPGFIRADQVYRQFESAELHIDIPPCRNGRTALSVTFASFTCVDVDARPFDLLSLSVKLRHNSRLQQVPGSQGLLDTPYSSLKVIPQALRRGTIYPLPPLELTTPQRQSIRIGFAKGAIDVKYGLLTHTLVTQDQGKLNAPVAGEAVLPNRGPVDVTLQCSDSDSLASCSKLWTYSDPGNDLPAQHPGHVVHTLSELGPYKRHEHPTHDTQVYRRKVIHGIDGPTDGYPGVLQHYHMSTYTSKGVSADTAERHLTARDWSKRNARKLVVIDDEGLGFTGQPALWAPFLYRNDDIIPFSHSGALPTEFCGLPENHSAEERESVRKRIIRHMQDTYVIAKASHWLSPSQVKLIDFLELSDALSRSFLVISGECLRAGLVNPSDKPGVKLSRTMSWERTLTDFVLALDDVRLKPILRFKHILVRLGLEGAIHCQDASDPSKRRITLFFDQRRIEGEYAGDELGQMPGLTTVFLAAATKRFSGILHGTPHGAIDAPSLAFSRDIHAIATYSLQCCRRYFDLGYGPTPSTVRKFERLQLPISQVFGEATIPACVDSGKHSFLQHVYTPASDGTVPIKYSILDTFIQNKRPADVGSPDPAGPGPKLYDPAVDELAVTRAAESLSLGRRIILDGVSEAFRSFKADFPYAQFEQMVTVDRTEIEGLRSIRKVLLEYISHKERAKPISIAVFGPPGSGKSFGVQQIAKIIAKDRVREFVFNMAQFDGFDEISRLLLRVRDAALDGKLPLVFFDEFDSPLNGQPLGWLKSFLAPMQDGRFQHDGQQLGIGKAVFVFAGGIAPSHSEFSRRQFWVEKFPPASGGGDVYRSAKGPDFHSRLRGFLDIHGPNPRHVGDGDSRSPSDSGGRDAYANESFVFVLRRALLIRQMIERLSSEEGARLLDQGKGVEMDSDVLNAFLLSEQYLHGVRSIQAIFEMCTISRQRVISKTLLPSQEQLEMHVDESFTNILTRRYSRLSSRIVEATFEKASFHQLRDDDRDVITKKLEGNRAPVGDV